MKAGRKGQGSATSVRLWPLLALNFFMADMQSGIGPFVGVFLQAQGWATGLIGTALTLLIGGACAAASNALALTTKSEDVMAPVINMVMMPVLLLSGILLPMTIGPKWLETASAFMPIRHVVDGVRESFGGDYASSGLLWGTVWSLLLFGLAVWWGTATFRKENS